MNEPKKGRKSWRPAQRLSLVDKKAGYVYRWCDKEPSNIAKRRADGWIMASELTGHSAKQEEPTAKNLTSVNEYRELVLMAIGIAIGIGLCFVPTRSFGP